MAQLDAQEEASQERDMLVRLDQEIEEESIFKLYTEKNCRYECVTKLAIDTCQCAPWDFMHISNEEECDVFGRTCFYRAMEKLTRDQDDPCSHCIPGCDQMKYKKEITEVKQIMEPIQGMFMVSWRANKILLFNCHYYFF